MPSPTYIFAEFSEGQRHTYRATVQVHQARGEALEQNRSFKGGMHWKKIKGREYLYRYRDRYGHGRCQGPRSPHTEKVMADFRQGRQEAAARLHALQPRLAEQARFARAALIHRVPRIVIKILQRLAQQEDLGRHLLVMEANAVFAYEYAAGVFLADPRRPTRPPDFLAHTRRRLTLATSWEVADVGLLAVLRRVDRSFQARPGHGLQFINQQGYVVAVNQPDTRRRDPGEPGTAAVLQIQRLLASPVFSQVVIGTDGSPATMAVPDPRAFALHHLGLSAQKDRPLLDRRRDRSLALAVADLILRHLPQYQFFDAELRRFPEALVRRAAQFATGL